jgi:ABC-2 type transport system permease protein
MIHGVGAFVRADFLTATSYRLNMALSLAALAVMTIPIYFVSQAIQPVAAEAIAGHGGDYFTFFLVGTAAYGVVLASVQAIPSWISRGIQVGTLEAVLATPARLPALLAGMASYRVLWSILRGLVILGAGWVLGATYVGVNLLPALLIVALLILAHLPFGMIAAAMVLVFRTPGPLTNAIMVGSALLGGVYYPTHVIPSWLEHLSALFPLTYGARSLRHVLLEGLPMTAVMGDLLVLAGFAVVLLLIGTVCLRLGLAHARRAGTLAEY